MDDIKKIMSGKNAFVIRMNQIVDFLKSEGIPLEKLHAIEIFGGIGKTDVVLAKNVKTFEIWEIDQKLKPQLEKSFPNSEIKICDSIDILNKSQKIRKFDLVLIDNPMNVFGIKKNSFEYCEHFDVIKNIPKLMDKEVIVIFLVNKKPFFFKKLKKENTLWRKRRQQFYGNVNTNDMSVEFLTSFYTELFRNMGLITIFSNIIPRHSPHLDYFIFMLRKNENQNENSLKTLDWLSLDPLFSRNQ
jgi:ADP-heptose:LPS heptosyltransferase|tara:strand:+ start:78 stop:809 length:732 start_codon:yes stop_codon:yes gene_type:complete